MEAKQQAVLWIDAPDKTGSIGVGNEDLGAKLGEEESVGKRGASQLEMWELELERQLGSQKRKQKIQEAPPDSEEETLEAPSDLNEETQEMLLDPEETQEAPSDSEEEAKDVAGLAAGSTDLEGLGVPARRKLTICGNIPPNNVIAHVESTGARRRGRSSAAKFSADDRRIRRGR